MCVCVGEIRSNRGMGLSISARNLNDDDYDDYNGDAQQRRLLRRLENSLSSFAKWRRTFCTAKGGRARARLSAVRAKCTGHVMAPKVGFERCIGGGQRSIRSQNKRITRCVAHAKITYHYFAPKNPPLDLPVIGYN